MLTWQRTDSAWLGSGFRIERLSSRVWGLFRQAQGTGGQPQVVADPGPIASLPTLEACKYKAEQLHRSSELGMWRKRLGAVAAGGAVAGLLFISQPLLVMAAGVVAVAALLELAMTWFEDRVGGAREVRQ